jgi:hypothetical protein
VVVLNVGSYCHASFLAEVTGYSLEANVKGFDTCCRRFLASVLPCCYALFDSSLALHVSIGNTSSAVYFLQVCGQPCRSRA